MLLQWVVHDWKCTHLLLFAILDCQNSDGLIGYAYSHEGYFQGSGIRGVRGEKISDCAIQCTNSLTCDAFQFRNDNGQCFLYLDNDLQDEVSAVNSTSYVYIKCTGIHLVWYNYSILVLIIFKLLLDMHTLFLNQGPQNTTSTTEEPFKTDATTQTSEIFRMDLEKQIKADRKSHSKF